jgi:HAD superfamily hydrolase (TIGR01509 family)
MQGELALIFDCDGVLGDTERFGHLPAFNQMFAEYGVPVTWSPKEYREKLRIGGGKERLASILTPELCRTLGIAADTSSISAVLRRWHGRKTEIYKELIASNAVPPRDGVVRLAQEAHEDGAQLAVASTSAEESVRAVVQHVFGDVLGSQFIVCAGDVVAHKKPAPDIYMEALVRLGVKGPCAIAIEDSGIGLQAALGAGLRTVVTVNDFTRDDDFCGASLVVDCLGEVERPLTVISAECGFAPAGPCLRLADLRRLIRPEGHKHEQEADL